MSPSDHDNSWAVGIHHIIVVAPGPTDKACRELSSLLPDVCCMWSGASLPPTEPKHLHDVAHNAFSPQRTLMHSRLRLAALALRLSYNLLFLDTDVILFDDPYRVLKALGPGLNLLAPGSVREVNLVS